MLGLRFARAGPGHGPASPGPAASSRHPAAAQAAARGRRGRREPLPGARGLRRGSPTSSSAHPDELDAFDVRPVAAAARPSRGAARPTAASVAPTERPPGRSRPCGSDACAALRTATARPRGARRHRTSAQPIRSTAIPVAALPSPTWPARRSRPPSPCPRAEAAAKFPAAEVADPARRHRDGQGGRPRTQLRERRRRDLRRRGRRSCEDDRAVDDRHGPASRASSRGIMSTSREPGLWEVDANLRPEGKDGALVRTLDSHVATTTAGRRAGSSRRC